MPIHASSRKDDSHEDRRQCVDALPDRPVGLGWNCRWSFVVAKGKLNSCGPGCSEMDRGGRGTFFDSIGQLLTPMNGDTRGLSVHQRDWPFWPAGRATLR